jgi:hypothetical protein
MSIDNRGMVLLRGKASSSSISSSKDSAAVINWIAMISNANRTSDAGGNAGIRRKVEIVITTGRAAEAEAVIIKEPVGNTSAGTGHALPTDEKFCRGMEPPIGDTRNKCLAAGGEGRGGGGGGGRALTAKAECRKSIVTGRRIIMRL